MSPPSLDSSAVIRPGRIALAILCRSHRLISHNDLTRLSLDLASVAGNRAHDFDGDFDGRLRA